MKKAKVQSYLIYVFCILSMACTAFLMFEHHEENVLYTSYVEQAEILPDVEIMELLFKKVIDIISLV